MPKCAVSNIIGHDGRTIQGQIEFTALPMTIASRRRAFFGYGKGVDVSGVWLICSGWVSAL